MLSPLLTLARPLILMDTETTGKNSKVDRIVELTYRVFPPDDISYGFTTLVNPGIPIPKEATHGNGRDYPGHGITDEMVKDAPTFRELLQTYERAMGGTVSGADPGPLLPLLSGNADYAGYNVRFDLEMLIGELGRCGFGLSMEGVQIVDALRLWQILEPRTLSHAVKHFLGREHEGAHSSLEDVNETADVLREQLERLTRAHEGPFTLHRLQELQFPRDPNWIDDTGRFAFNEAGDAVITFGKYAGTLLSQVDKGFLKWMVTTGTFTPQAKLIARNAVNGQYPRRPSAQD